MDIDITSVELPDLSRQIKLSSFKPHFNGNYSSVYQARFQDQLVAVKVIKEINGAKLHTMERKLKRELTVWALLRHPNILPILGFAKDHELFQPFGALISPWRAQGNASQFLKDHGRDLTKDQRLNMWKGVVAGVQYLHEHTPVLVHGDLKLANVMIDDQNSPQICDFGLVSIFLEEGHSGMTTTSYHTGTERYMAYELVRDGDTVVPTVASDVFALGCIGLECYFLRIPYSNRRNNMQGRIFTDIKAGIRPATPPEGCDGESQEIWNLLAQCWEHNPNQRPTAGELLISLQLQIGEANYMEDLTVTYPPTNPVPNLPSAGPSNLGSSNLYSKQKQHSQRNEVDETKLAEAFNLGSFRVDPALRLFLDIIQTYSFYLEDEHEPLLGTPEAERTFAQVRASYPNDTRFISRNDSRSPLQPTGKEEESQSIFMIMTENNQCLICGQQKDTPRRVLGHVRSDIGHRPYHCTCDKCTQSTNPRRFFSDNLLDDHLKSQQVTQECIYCHNLFRRGGMKRHVASKHPEHAQGTPYSQDNADRDDE